MKRRFSRLFFILCAPLACSLGDTFSYPLGTNTIEVVFEDSSLSLSTQTNVFQDILCIREPWSQATVEFSDQENTHGVIDDEGVYWTPWGNEEYELLRKFVTVSNGVLRCTVRTSLSMLYESALERTSGQSNIWQNALLFAQYLRLGDYSSITSNNVHDIFFHADFTEAEYKAEFSGIMQTISGMSFSSPSVLSFAPKEAGYFGFPTPAYWVQIPSGYPRNGANKEYGHVCAVWFDSKWHLVLPSP